MRIITLVSSLVLGLLAGAPAGAAVITQTYGFSFNGFVDVGPGAVAPPIAAMSGSFTISFDPTLYYSNDTTHITVNFLNNAPVSSAIGFDNFPSAGVGQPGYLSIGGILFDADFISFGTDDFAINYKYFDPTQPILGRCSDGYACGNAPGSTVASGYTLAGYNDSAWLPASGTVPEPASWALMITGFGLVGAAQRRRSALMSPATPTT